MHADVPHNRHPERSALEDRSTFVLTFLADADGRTSADELATYLRQRDIISVVAHGDDLGTPGASVAIVAVDDTGHVLLDAEGRPVAGQQIEHLVPGLAHLTRRRVVVNDEVVVAPDGSESEPDESALAAGTAACLVMWRASASSPGIVRGLAHGLAAPVEHVTIDGWTVAALPFGTTVDGEALAAEVTGPSERPVVTLVRAGESRALTWHDRERRTPVTIELAAPPTTTAVLRDVPPDSASGRLAAELGDGSLRVVPRTTRIPAATIEQLRTMDLSRETLLGRAADALGLPPGVASIVELGGATARDAARERASAAPRSAGEDLVAAAEPPARWLDLPGASVVQPDATIRAAVMRSLVETALDEPQGDGLYTRFRRWLWNRPRTLVAVSMLEIAVGVACAAWAADGGTLLGQNWLVWLVAGLWIIDGAPDAAAGIAILRRRPR